MKERFFILCVVLLALGSCKQPPWAGKFKSQNCLTLEYVEFYQDNTADVRYYGASFATNHRMTRQGDNRFHVDYYTFELREDGRMYEVGGYDNECILSKDTTHGFWDKMFEP